MALCALSLISLNWIYFFKAAALSLILSQVDIKGGWIHTSNYLIKTARYPQAVHDGVKNEKCVGEDAIHLHNREHRIHMDKATIWTRWNINSN